MRQHTSASAKKELDGQIAQLSLYLSLSLLALSPFSLSVSPSRERALFVSSLSLSLSVSLCLSLKILHDFLHIERLFCDEHVVYQTEAAPHVPELILLYQ